MLQNDYFCASFLESLKSFCWYQCEKFIEKQEEKRARRTVHRYREGLQLLTNFRVNAVKQ
jgi:hypothetical protein